MAPPSAHETRWQGLHPRHPPRTAAAVALREAALQDSLPCRATCRCIVAAGAVVLVVLAYLLPLLVGLGVTADTSDWQLGYFAAVGKQVGWADQLRWPTVGRQACIAPCLVTVPGSSRLMCTPHSMLAGRRQLAGMVDRGGCSNQPDRAV